MVRTLGRLRSSTDLSQPEVGTRFALRSLARRHQRLDEEIADLDQALAGLTKQAAPALLDKPGVGPIVAAQLLVTAGDNPERLRSEASFAHLAGAPPIPASSGRRDRHRLNRGGDPGANNALHTIALVRMKYHSPTRAHVTRRSAQGLSKKDILRCLKRAIAREIFHELTKPPQPSVAA